MKMTWAAAALACVVGASAGMAQVPIEPPAQGNNANSIAPPPMPTPAAPATQPGEHATAGAAAATLPSAASVLQGLLNEKPTATVTTTNPSGVNVVPQREAVAPNEPSAVRLREGQMVYQRVGRLVKDEKTGAMLFVFDADGKEMHDPPMGVVPCKFLALMEDLSENGTKAVKFRISGQVTQYRGKNFVYPTFASVVKDLNQGIGG